MIEKSCSRCALISWCSDTGSLGRVCRVDSKPCDTNGSTYVDGVIHVGRLEF